MQQTCRPFSVVEGAGFQAVAKKLIQIGAKYGDKMSVADLLPCATTVSRHLDLQVKTEKELLIQQLVKVVKFGITTDMWTSEKTNDAYITVTAHYLDSHWKMVSAILATRCVEDRHTAKVIQQTVRLRDRQCEHNESCIL